MLPMDCILPFNFRKIGDLVYVLERQKDVAITTLTNQNFLSSYICIFLPMMVFYYINTGKKLALPIVIMLFLGLIFSLTLTGYITFVTAYIGIILYLLIRSDNKKCILVRTILLSTILLVLFISVNIIKDNKYMLEFINIRQETSNLVEGNEEFGTGRMQIWKRCLTIINDNKLFGIGPDSLVKEYHKVPGLEKYDEKGNLFYTDKAHSEPLQIAVTSGIPAMIIYLIFVSIICLLLIKICLKKDKNLEDEKGIYNHMVLISILSYLMQSMICISVVEVAPIFWAVLGLGGGIIYTNKETIKKVK